MSTVRKSSTLVLFIMGVTIVASSLAYFLYRVHAYVPASSPVLDYNFVVDDYLYEASSPAQSTSPYWWLQSGGFLKLTNGKGATNIGELNTDHRIRQKYAALAPLTTDDGYHPQNDFKLLTKKAWADVRQEVVVKILGDNLDNTRNIHPWNGISLIGRYQNDDNYYYGGIRADGRAVIKKKSSGSYRTLDIKSFFSGAYDPNTQPSVLPKNQEMGLRFETYSEDNGSVTLRLWVDKQHNGNWQLAAEAFDSGMYAPVIASIGKAGLISSFMDLEMDDFQVTPLLADSPQGTEPLPITSPTQTPTPTPGPTVNPEPIVSSTQSTNYYGLDRSATVEETGSMGSSAHSDWWVNSGAYFIIENGIGMTTQGSLAHNDVWRERYAAANPVDTDNGYHPQNIFRLVTTKQFDNVEQQAYFRINDIQMSDSWNRAGHNGFLLFNRYHSDGQTLYYTGVRVDGKVIIKKKYHGTYYTMASNKVYSGSYDRTSNPNLIPENTWIGLRSSIVDQPDGSVRVRVYLDKNNSGVWELAAEAVDTASNYGGQPIRSGYAGVRTDFMDAAFKQYQIK